MSGVSDYAFRKRCVLHGAGVAVAEMTSASRLIGNGSDFVARRHAIAGSINMVQIAGRDPAIMAEAARICAGEGADIIDINMGCPAKKVTGGYAGSALLQEPELALKIIEATVAASPVPVTLKTRLGWDDQSLNASDLCANAEAAGIQMITIHGRTRCQFYKGQADWVAAKAVRDAIKIPMVINGDIVDLASAVKALESSDADAVMVGRGSYGQPWLPGLMAKQAGAKDEYSMGPFDFSAQAEYVISHYEDMLDLYGIEKGLRHARKHLGWYLDVLGVQVSTALRQDIIQSTDTQSVIAALNAVFENQDFSSSKIGNAA